MHNPWSGSSSALQSPQGGLKWHGCSLLLKNQNREPKFGKWVNQRPVSISHQDPDARPQSGTPASSKAPKEDLKDVHVLCTFKIKIERQNLECQCIKDKWPYPSQDPNSEPYSGISNVLKSSKCGLRGNWCSLNLQNQDKEPILRTWMYQRPVTISKSRSKCQTPVRNLQQSPKSGHKGHGCCLHLQNQDR